MATKLTPIQILTVLQAVCKFPDVPGCLLRKEEIETLLTYIETLLEHQAWYEEAIVASNTHGYACMSAAQVIDAMSARIEELEKANDH